MHLFEIIIDTITSRCLSISFLACQVRPLFRSDLCPLLDGSLLSTIRAILKQILILFNFSLTSYLLHTFLHSSGHCSFVIFSLVHFILKFVVFSHNYWMMFYKQLVLMDLNYHLLLFVTAAEKSGVHKHASCYAQIKVFILQNIVNQHLQISLVVSI